MCRQPVSARLQKGVKYQQTPTFRDCKRKSNCPLFSYRVAHAVVVAHPSIPVALEVQFLTDRAEAFAPELGGHVLGAGSAAVLVAELS